MAEFEEIPDYNLSDDEKQEDAPVEKKEEAQPKRTADDTYVDIHSSTFKEFVLKPDLLKAISDCGFEHPSVVQYECIPTAILGSDVICQAKSGMGKTAVFVLSVLQQLDAKADKPGCLVLAHTREMAYQICNEFDRFGKYLGIKTAVCYGGVAPEVHKDLLEKENPHIVIGTPGRILQLARDKAKGGQGLNLKNIKYFVLDECDKMLESVEMRADVQEIFKLTPHNKQVMMFSATLPGQIRDVCKKFMNKPLEIYINDGAKLTLHGLKQYYLELREDEKNRKLVDLLDALQFNQAVVFVRDTRRCDALNKILKSCGFPSTSIHSKLPQEKRIARYRKFKEVKKRVMVATDLFGRGIDIERVNVVFNYDMADNSDSYLHRVGRAGRFGTKGLAISFISSKDDATVLNDVQSRFSVSVPVLPAQVDASTYMQN